MEDKLNPRAIYENYLGSNITKTELINLLSSYIENSHDLNLRRESLNILNIFQEKSKEIFNILETVLISDENEELRVLAMESLIKNYFEESVESLKWTILNDKSPMVLKILKKISEN
ncbi:MAG: hypothetical protein ACFFC1_12545, partial [Promethearchaeota archaeon]